MARLCMRVYLLGLLPMIAFGVMACASGFEGNGDDDGDPPRIDARPATIDAPAGSVDARTIDAPVSTMIDAPVSLPDAGIPGSDGGGGLFCSANSDCAAMTGTCCFYLIQPPGFCVPGTTAPPPINCVPE